MIRSLFHKIKNFFYWGWKLRNDYNYDHTSIYSILELKLKKLRTVCYHKGHHVWSEKSRQYKAISECIEICKKLQNEESPNYDLFIKEFGEFSSPRFKKLSCGNFKMIDTNSKFKEKQLLIIFRKDEKLRQLRKERLFYLLNKWSDAWWN